MKQNTGQILALSAAYKLLASVFSYPADHIYEIMREGFWTEVIKDLKIENLLSTASGHSSQLYITKAEEFWGQPLKEIQSLYTALFDFAYPRPACPPYAGMYLPGGQSYPGPRTELMGELGAKYFLWGLDLEEELADHIAVELEFIHFLLAMEYGALRNNNQAYLEKLKAEREWLYGHLQTWIPSFYTRMEEHAPDSFWGTALKLLMNLLETNQSIKV
ncbi:TorD/DmsD family molecular chaperone [Syntrophomonas erecta]